MLTNLVGSVVVALVTNSVERVPMYMHPIANEPRIWEGGGWVVDAVFRAELRAVPNPTVKTNVITCKEVTTLRLDWNGPREIVSERVLWESNQVLRLEWVK